MRRKSILEMIRHVRTVALAGACLLAGCGRGDAPALAKVTGTVRRGGKPVADLQVNFIPNSGRPSWGLTDAKGRFKLYYTPEEDGAVLGEHRVFVAFNQAQPQSFAGDGKKTGKEGPDLHETVDEPNSPQATAAQTELSEADRLAIKEKYGSPKNSPLRFKIEKSGETVEIDLD